MRLAIGIKSLLLGLALGTNGCAIFNGPNENGQTVPIVRNANKEFIVPVCSWWALKRQNVVIQKYDYSCGAAALATIAQYYWGDNKEEAEFLVGIFRAMTKEEAEDRHKNGLTMTDLRKSAVDRGYLASMGTRSISQLLEVKIPVIVRIQKDGFEHFVVFRGIVDDRVYLADPIRGNLRLPVWEFAQQWTDGAVLVIVKKNTKPPESSPLSVCVSTPVQHELRAARRFIQKTTEPSVGNPLISP